MCFAIDNHFQITLYVEGRKIYLILYIARTGLAFIMQKKILYFLFCGKVMEHFLAIFMRFT